MKLLQLYTYPIKSLRPTALTEAIVTKHGFPYDRRFMLLKVHPDRLQNMAVAHFPEMTLFLTDIRYPEDDELGVGTIYVTFTAPGMEKAKKLEVPLLPDTKTLELIDINMHNSCTKAYKMPSQYNEWFSSCFGYEVVLAYLGENLRGVLFESLKPPTNNSWLATISNSISVLYGSKVEAEQITFADCAPYLIVSQTSLTDVSSRLPDGEEMDMSKFRPNIVVQGAESPWEEDFWGEIRIGEAGISLTENCGRCQSINIDFATGKPGKGESGSILKKLQKDRRVDKGTKYSPVFGRYGFLARTSEAKRIRVGDEVSVTKINSERTVWSWPGL